MIESQAIERAISRFDARSLTALLWAAGSSPCGRRRLPSFAVLLRHVLRCPPMGTEVADVADIDDLLDAVQRAAPAVLDMEDFAPADPRRIVRFPVLGDRLAVDPGLLDRPLDTLRLTQHLAYAADPVLVETVGFGLTDLLEITLRYTDTALADLRPGWSPAEAEGPGVDMGPPWYSPCSVTSAEVDAASRFVRDFDVKSLVARCRSPRRAVRAWEWATARTEDLGLRVEPMTPLYGPVLAVEGLDGFVPVPPSLALEGLMSAAGLLVAGLDADKGCARRLATVAATRAHRLLTSTGSPLGPEAPSRGGRRVRRARRRAEPPMTGVVVRGRRHAVVVEVVSAFGLERLAEAVNDAAARLHPLRTAEGLAAAFPHADVSRDVDVTAVVLYGGPTFVHAARGPGAVWLHVEELASLLAEARREDEGADLAWDFLADLASPPGDELPPLDVLDLWRSWLNVGSLTIDGETLVLAVGSSAVGSEWDRAASLDRIDQILADIGAAPAAEWDHVDLDDSGVALLSRLAQREIWLVNPRAMLVVIVPLSPHDTRTIGNPRLGYGLASGVQAAVSTVADAFPQLPSGRALVCVLDITHNQTSDGGNHDRVGISFAIGPEPIRPVALGLDDDFFEWFARNPVLGHEVIGRALVHAWQLASGTSRDTITDELNDEQEAFLVQWNSTDPVLLVAAAPHSLPVGNAPPDPLPRGRSARARARNAVAAALRARHVSAGQYVGADASEFCGATLRPTIEAMIGTRLAACDPEYAMRVIAAHLNLARGDRTHTAYQRGFGLTGPWAASVRADALAGSHPSLLTRPLELLVEMLVHDRPSGDRQLDRFDVAELAALAEMAIDVGLAEAAQRSHLHTTVVEMTPHGVFDVAPIGPPAPDREAGAHVDTAAYNAARRAHEARIPDSADAVRGSAGAEGDPDRLRPGERAENPFRKLTDAPDVPRPLLDVDEALRSSFGAGFDAITAVLGTAVDWPLDADGLALIDRADLLTEAGAWSALPSDEIRAAIDLLTLTGEGLRAAGLRHWEQPARRHRLALRPLVDVNGRLLVMPYQVDATQQIFVTYLGDGRLPWSGDDVPQAARDAMSRYRQAQNRALERDSAAAAESLALPHIARLTPEQGVAAGIVGLTREIDLLVADPERRRLLVCEVKDLGTAFTPRELAHQVAAFHRPKGHVDLLMERVRAVEQDAAAAAACCGVTDKLPWVVTPVIVTRNVEAAAFVPDARVAFVVMDDLPTAFVAADFGPGQFPIGVTS